MPDASSAKRGVVLIADDDPVMRMLMLEMLGQVGLDAIEARDGREAVELCRTAQVDLILMMEIRNIDPKPWLRR